MYQKDKHWLEKLMATEGQLFSNLTFLCSQYKVCFLIFVCITSIFKRFSYWKSPNYNVFTMSFERAARQKPITIRSGNFHMSLQRPDTKSSRWYNTFIFQKFSQHYWIENFQLENFKRNILMWNSLDYDLMIRHMKIKQIFFL